MLPAADHHVLELFGIDQIADFSLVQTGAFGKLLGCFEAYHLVHLHGRLTVVGWSE